MKLKQVGDKKLLYIMAVDNEYGENLRKLFTPLFTGVGPVEAAISTGRALENLAQKNSLPDFVISLGSAGSAKLVQTQIYQASHISYRDMDASPLGFKKGVTPFLDHEAKIKMPLKFDGIKSATLSTGANIVSGDDYKNIDADMVDMESFAILRACQIFNIPMIALRGISDGKKELNHIDDWTQYLHIIDEKMAKIVMLIEEQIKIIGKI